MVYNPEYYQKNKEAYKASMHKWAEKQGTTKNELVLAAVKRHYQANREKVLAYKKVYHQRKKAERLARQAELAEQPVVEELAPVL